MKRKPIIGVTGGIASGKSFVVNEFRKLGASVVDADKISRYLLKSGSIETSRIIDNFGSEILNKNGTINRKMLGQIVFSDPVKRKILDKILHPAIIKRIKEEADMKSRHNITILDVPLLFEKNLEKYADLTLLVYVPENIQFKRLKERNGYLKNDAGARIRSQMPAFEKAKKCDIILENILPKKRIKILIQYFWNFFSRIDI